MTKESPASLTPEQRAIRIEDACGPRHGGEWVTTCLVCYEEAVRAAEARGRERGIEEAARIVETIHLEPNPDCGPALVSVPYLARKLRALLSAEPQATPLGNSTENNQGAAAPRSPTENKP